MLSMMSFQMDADIKAQMDQICEELGMTPSAAFNLFAHAFVQAKGMPFPVVTQESASTITKAKILSDTDSILSEFTEDYRRLAE